MSIVKEIYQVARGEDNVELSLQETLAIRLKAEKEIFEKVNVIGQLETIDLIAMMLPIIVAPLKEGEYFGNLFGSGASESHARLLAARDMVELSDSQRIFKALIGKNEKQSFLFSLKVDPTSPAGVSVNRLLMLIRSSDFGDNKEDKVAELLQNLNIPEGNSVMPLFSDTLEYTLSKFNDDMECVDLGTPRIDQIVLSNLLNTFLLTSMAAPEFKVFNEKIGYSISTQTGRRTYLPNEGEVLFEVSQINEVPTSWFDIFDKVDNEDFDLKTELSHYIKTNCAHLASAE